MNQNSASISFQVAPSASTDKQSYDIKLGDFNGDGITDLVTANSKTYYYNYNLEYVSGSISVLLGKGNGNLSDAINLEVGKSAFAVTVADFNGDNFDDIAVANTAANLVTIFNGGEDGIATKSRNISGGKRPKFITSGDFNNDNIPDLVINKDILLGKGDGTFRRSSNWQLQSEAGEQTVGDFNNDGNQDIAVISNQDIVANNSTIAVSFGRGNGEFENPVNITINELLSSLTTEDFNGDNIDDIAWTNINYSVFVFNPNPSKVGILFSDGNQNFTAGNTFGGDNAPSAISSDDLNGDGINDLVVTNGFGDNVSVFISKGNGEFKPRVDYAVGYLPQSVAIGDVNQDGIVDITVANLRDLEDKGSVSVLTGKGDGSFVAARTFPTIPDPGFSVLADFNNDGIIDVAVQGEGVSILLGKNDGTFRNGINLDFTVRSTAITTEDFNGDGIADLAVGSQIFGKDIISVFLGKGDSTFNDRINVEVGENPYALVTGDLNGDGKQDLVVGLQDYRNSRVSILLGDGSGNFTKTEEIKFNRFTATVALEDFNGDGIVDIIANKTVSTSDSRYNYYVAVVLGKGDGTFSQTINSSTQQVVTAIALGDFNSDGIKDVATANILEGKASILLGQGNGRFTEVGVYDVGTRPQSVSVGDFNSDGVEDLAFANFNGVLILPGVGDGSFAEAINFAQGGFATSANVYDFNEDGKDDLLVTNESPNNISVLFNTGKTSTNTPPVAVADSFSTKENQIIQRNVLTNDTDSNGDNLTVTAINGNSNNVGNEITLSNGVKLTLNANGTFSYNPNSVFDSLNTGQMTTDSFNYTISDDKGGIDTATVTITINGITNTDTLVGGDGDDEINGSSNNDNIYGGAGNDTLRGEEGRDTLRGESGDDILYGNERSDFLDGNEGNDILRGGVANDYLVGSIGNDTLNGGNDFDRVDYTGFNQAITFKSFNLITKGNNGKDLLVNVEEIIAPPRFPNNININLGLYNTTSIDVNLYDRQLIFNNIPGTGKLQYTIHNFANVFGTNQSDIITGDNKGEGNILTGKNGNDLISGKGGNDTLFGNSGNDILNGNVGNDYLSSGEGNDVLFGGEGDDILVGNEGNDTLNGNVGNDTLFGREGNDILSGGKGNDTLFGGDGDDTLVGNEGDDLFEFTRGANVGVDTVRTYTDGVDKFLLSDRFSLGSLEFSDLTLTQKGEATTITLTENNQLLGIVLNTNVNQLNADDFITN